MIVDGKRIAQAIYTDVAHTVSQLARPPVLVAVTCAPNFETKKYLELKKRKAAFIGITLRVLELPESITTSEVIAQIDAMAGEADGIVIQLPFPPHIDREAVLAAVPKEKDPDAFSYQGQTDDVCLPPVVGAIHAIATFHQIDFLHKNVVVLGNGRLVGEPIMRFLQTTGAHVQQYVSANAEQRAALQAADIIISGIGTPHFVTADMVKNKGVVFDAGTSEDGGLVAGDVHRDVASHAALFTPVPGGIGPITIAVLLQNLVHLIKEENNTTESLQQKTL
jgi:methylenetetrahydrofolate dehydrogenase (NADP+)/methenyltetrahydrofolate cyclohydrolase